MPDGLPWFCGLRRRTVHGPLRRRNVPTLLGQPIALPAQPAPRHLPAPPLILAEQVLPAAVQQRCPGCCCPGCSADQCRSETHRVSAVASPASLSDFVDLPPTVALTAVPLLLERVEGPSTPSCGRRFENPVGAELQPDAPQHAPQHAPTYWLAHHSGWRPALHLPRRAQGRLSALPR